MTTQIKIITPKGMFGSYKGEHLLATAMRIIGVGFGGPDDWCAKYGANVENAVFMMRRYCWCEKQGECPWCTGCGVYQDTCQACKIANAHTDTCFQIELRRRHDKYDDESGYNAIDEAAHAPEMTTNRVEVTDFGTVHITDRTEAGKAAHKKWCKAHSKRNEAHDLITETLYRERGLEVQKFIWFCDCGAEMAGKFAREQGGGCDYHHGRGIFARFAPYQHIRERHYYDPPLFWYKPTDFRLTWYKHIGRDMASNNDSLSGDFMEKIFATHPKGMTVDEAIDETQRQEEESAKGFSEIFSASAD